jgi:ATP-dependent RNA helicase RhlE
VSESETRYLKDIEKLIGSPIEATIVAGFEPGAADVSAYESRPPRMERPTVRTGERSSERPPDRSNERRAPRAKPVASRDALFDAPYVPSDTPRSSAALAPTRPTSKKPVAALFRSPVKSEPAGQ